MKAKKKKYNPALRKLEKKIVRQNIEEVSEKEVEELEHKVSEDPKESQEGLGIEKDESAGQDAYPEITEAVKKESDEDEEEE